MPSDKLHHNTGKGKKSESESSLPERKKYPQTKKKENKTKPLNKEKRELLEELDTLNLAELSSSIFLVIALYASDHSVLKPFLI